MHPGEHVWVIGPPGEAVAFREEGLQLRDTALIVTPHGNLFAYLFRKPLEGTVAENVLRHGVGGLWVDGCRIAHVTVAGGNHAANPHLRNPIRVGSESEQNMLFPRKDGEHLTPTDSAGRWPPNLLLVHAPGCAKTGTKRVPATSMHGRIEATLKVGYSLFWGKDRIGEKQPISGHGDPDGMETVEAWACQDGCPVQMLDEQSGLSRSPETYVRSVAGSNKTAYGVGIGEPAGKESLNYGDSGGASRFYPQFQNLPEALDWLVKLLGPRG